MKLIKKGSKGEEVKILQALIGAKIDGFFGNDTKLKLMKRQTELGIDADGSCGAATWKALGFVESKSEKLYVMCIPLKDIELIRVNLHDNCSAYSVQALAKERGADIAINAGIFSTKKGKSYWKNLSDIIVAGKVMNQGNFSDLGIAFGNGFKNAEIFQSTTAENAEKRVDFIGGAPPLIINGKPYVDMKGLDKNFFNQFTERMAIGFNERNFYIITTGLQNNCRLSSVLYEGIFQGVNTLINLDGGINTAMTLYGQCVFSTGINVPSAIVIKTHYQN